MPKKTTYNINKSYKLIFFFVCLLTLVTLLSTTFSTGCFAKQSIKILTLDPHNFKDKIYFNQIERDFEDEHPNINIIIRFWGESIFKNKLPQLLKSDGQPDIFFSRGGENFQKQPNKQWLQDITQIVQKEWRADFTQTTIDAFSQDGIIYGGPLSATEVVFWYNKELIQKAGININEITTWSHFLTAVAQLKKTGITPILVGGKDLWPLQLYWSYLAVRIAGKDGLEKMTHPRGEGFNYPSVLEVNQKFSELATLHPFQEDFMINNDETASGMFGDGKGAFYLMENSGYQSQKSNSLHQMGLGDDKLGILSFPLVSGGAGKATDTFGGIKGFLVNKNANKITPLFLKYLLNNSNQKVSARNGLWNPVSPATNIYIQNDFYRQIAHHISKSTFHQIYLDQALGLEITTTINQISGDLAEDIITAEEATNKLQSAWIHRQWVHRQ